MNVFTKFFIKKSSDKESGDTKFDKQNARTSRIKSKSDEIIVDDSII